MLKDTVGCKYSNVHMTFNSKANSGCAGGVSVKPSRESGLFKLWLMANKRVRIFFVFDGVLLDSSTKQFSCILLSLHSEWVFACE